MCPTVVLCIGPCTMPLYYMYVYNSTCILFSLMHITLDNGILNVYKVVRGAYSVSTILRHDFRFNMVSTFA